MTTQEAEKPNTFRACEDCKVSAYCEGEKRCAAEMLEDPNWKIVNGVHVHCKPNDQTQQLGGGK